MSGIDEARAKFTQAFETRRQVSATGVFDEGLRRVEAGASKDEIRAYLDEAVGVIGTRGDSGACAADCSSSCSDYPDGPPWYACYAGCFAGCMSA